MQSLKIMIFTGLILFLCLSNAFAVTCYTPNYGYYECNPNYESYPYPDEDWGGSFIGIVIGGGGYYDSDHDGHWQGGHGDGYHHGGGGYHSGGNYHGGGHHRR